MPDTNQRRLRQRLYSIGPVAFLTLGCFVYSSIQILADRIDIESGDGAKCVNTSLYIQADPTLALTELFDDASAAGNNSVFALAFGLSEIVPWHSDNPNAPALICNLIASYLIVLLGWLWCKENHGEIGALLVVAFFLGNNFFTAHSLNTFQEPLGAVFVLLALLLSGTKERKVKDSCIIACCLLVASLFRHEYFLFGIYLAIPLIWKRQFRQAAPLVFLPPMYYLAKSVHQRINGSLASEYQSWLDHPVIGSPEERFVDGLSILREVTSIDFLPFGEIIGGVLLVLGLWFGWKHRSSFLKNPAYLLVCHSVALLLLWMMGFAPHVQHRYAAILEYLFPLVCVAAIFGSMKRTGTSASNSKNAPPATMGQKAMYSSCALIVSLLSLWAHRAEVYNIRFNRIPQPMLKARQFLEGNIKPNDTVYFGYASSWETYFQNHCYHKGCLGNSYAYSNEIFYGITPRSLRNPEERGETTAALQATRHMDLIDIPDLDYLVVANSKTIAASPKQFAQKRGARAILSFLHPDNNTPKIHHWRSPHLEDTPQLAFSIVFENQNFVVFRRSEINDS